MANMNNLGVLTPCIIDLEASGLGHGSYPIEVGFVTADKLLGCSLIKPVDAWTHWSEEAEKLHGIKRALLHQKGRTVTQVAQWLNDSLNGMTVYSDAWVNDMCWLGKIFDEAGLIQKFRIESILSLLSEAEREKWSPFYQKILAETATKRHRASTDALNIQRTYLALKLSVV